MSRTLPILFNGDMVRAILDGRKTVTRRLVKPQPTYSQCDGFTWKGIAYGTDLPPTIKGAAYNFRCAAPYHPGDILYVRETWGTSNLDYDDKSAYIVYKASENEKDEGCKAVRLPDDKFEKLYDFMAENALDWRPSIHMPKEAARIWLNVKDVRVERLQDMTTDDCHKEGINIATSSVTDGETLKRNHDFSLEKFGTLWNSTINKSDLDRYGWDANPWVWVIEFERCEKPKGWCA